MKHTNRTKVGVNKRIDRVDPAMLPGTMDIELLESVAKIRATRLRTRHVDWERRGQRREGSGNMKIGKGSTGKPLNHTAKALRIRVHKTKNPEKKNKKKKHASKIK